MFDSFDYCILKFLSMQFQPDSRVPVLIIDEKEFDTHCSRMSNLSLSSLDITRDQIGNLNVQYTLHWRLKYRLCTVCPEKNERFE